MISPSSSQLDQNDDEIDFRVVFRTLWMRKWLILATMLGFSVLTAIIVLMIPNRYRAEVTLAPNKSDSAGNLGALAANYGGLANLAGINLGGNSSDKSRLGLEVIKSRKFIADFVLRHDALIPLMAADGWSPSSGELSIDTDAYDSQNNEWVRDVRAPRGPIPSPQEAYEEFSKILSVNQDDRTGFIKVSIEHHSPTIARDWVALMIEDVNETVRQQDIARARQAIEYLEGQIAKTSLAGLQSVFFNLIEEQTKTVMLASISKEYLFTVIDPPVAPEEKSSPARALLVLLGAMLGALLSAVIALVRGPIK